MLSGDSAEFQLAAVLLGVPHPTTYPLYTMLGHAASRLLPLGEPAWRVTLVSAICAALAMTLFFLLARRLLGSAAAALVAAVALGLSPGLWNAATLAEVYALLALLIVALALALSSGRLRLAALVGGLGFSHHGLFAITALPLLAAAVLVRLARPGAPGDATPRPGRAARAAWCAALLALFLAGLAPWLYPPAQLALHGPFDGQDYGLPRHYYWGAPRSYGEVLDLMTGGTIRRGIFRAPDAASALETLRMVGRRLLFEFGPAGAGLGLLGAWWLARRSPWAWRGAAWVFFSTLIYLLLLGPAVGDAPVFTLPMLLPWALWIGAAADGARRWAESGRMTWRLAPAPAAAHGPPASAARRSSLVLAGLLALTLAWGATRYRVSAKQHLWLYREFGQVTLSELPPGAAVIAHWEQGMALQYLRLVAGERPDVWVDVVEPSDDPWGPRAERRYPDRPVFFVGQAESVAGLPVELVREGEYASLFRLRR